MAQVSLPHIRWRSVFDMRPEQMLPFRLAQGYDKVRTTARVTQCTAYGSGVGNSTTMLLCLLHFSIVAGTKVLLQCVLVCGVKVGFCHVPPLRPSPSSKPTCLTHVPPSPSVLAARGTGRVRRVEGRARA